MTDGPEAVDLDELAALEEQRAFLLASLDDLDAEHGAGDLDDADYETLRADYTARAARVIGAIDDRQRLIDTALQGRRRGRTVIVLSVVVVLAVVAGLSVAALSGSERDTPGGTTSGPEPSAATQRCVDMMQQTFAPTEDGEADSAVAVLECFTARIDDDPDDAVAYAYRGRTLGLLATQLQGIASPGDVRSFATRSRADLDAALQIAPDYADALAFAAMGAIADGDTVAARDYLARIDRLQLPGNDPILPIVNNAIRPSLTAPEVTTSTTRGDREAPGSRQDTPTAR